MFSILKPLAAIFLALIWLIMPATAATKTISVTIPHQPDASSPLVDVYVEGQGPYKFILDTGSGMSSISHRLHQQLGLKSRTSENAKVLTVLGYTDVRYTDMVSIGVTQANVKKRTRLLISPPSRHKYDGILGLNDLRGVVIANDPAGRQLHLKLPSKMSDCDVLKQLKRCGIHPRDMPIVDAQLGSMPAHLIFDTGYSGSAPLIMFKSDFTNNIWNRNASSRQTITGFSDRPLKHVLSNDFSFAGNAACYADMYIRDPNDSSDKFREVAGLIGWWTIKNVPFTLDLKTLRLDYPSRECPYTSVNTLGIGGFGSNGNKDTILIGNLTTSGPAYRAGLRNHMEIERIYLSNGQVIETFENGLSVNSALHVHAPAGSTIGFDVLRNGRTSRVNVVSEPPDFITLR